MDRSILDRIDDEGAPRTYGIDTKGDPDRVVVGVDGTWNALGAVT